MLLNKRYFAPDDPAGGDQPNPAAGGRPTFDRSQLPDFLQKYPGNSMDEVLANAGKGYWQLVDHSKKVEDAYRSAAEKAAAYDRIQAATSGGAPKPPSALDKLAEELGVGRDFLRNAFGEVAREEAANTFSSALGPVLTEYTATEELAAEIGDEFTKIKPQVQKWLAENPAEKARFDAMRSNGFAREGWELAIRKWGATQGGQPTNKAAAGSVSGGRPSGERTQPEGPNMQALGEAARYYEQYGDASAMIHERVKGTSISQAVAAMNAHLNGLGGTG